MSFPEVQPGCKVALSDTKGFCSREPLRAGRRTEPRQKMAAPAPRGRRLTLRCSEGICHRTPPAGRTHGTTEPSVPTKLGELQESALAGRDPKI